MIRTFVGLFHQQKCLKAYGINQTDKLLKKVKQRQKKEDNKRKKKFYDNDLPHQKKLTQDVYNRLRKLQEFEWFTVRGLIPECISCGKQNMDWCNGHFKTVKTQGAIRYDPINNYLQCNRYCNKALSGNIYGNKNTRGYLAGLKSRFGEEEANKIIAYCEIDRIKIWECDELIEMRKKFNREIRCLLAKKESKK